MATVTAAAAGTNAGTNTGSAWRTEQHSAVTDKALSLTRQSEFSLERYNMLMANTLRVNQLAYETFTTAEDLAPTLARLETSEAHDLLFITQSIMTVRSNCEELKCTAVSPDWAPVALVAGMDSMDFGIPYQAQKVPCNSFALTTLHCRRCCSQLRHCFPAAGFHTILTLMRSSTVSGDVDQTPLRSLLELRSKVM